ncbi:MAG TPA: aminoacetone oxidase family FAD-binding enzyme, partial [Clostridiaceae bacterium]|nr:aminoacetone oxidase family FAD-binding enzyme [Clostridiaceae bacterium]
MKKPGIIIIGGGAAGLAAAVEATKGPFGTLLLEKNAHCGKKMLLTGGGRCNFSHSGTTRDLISAFHGQGKFLYSSLSRYGSDHYIAFLRDSGVAVKCEDDGRYFPQNNRAATVRDAFIQALKQAGCPPLCQYEVRAIEHQSESKLYKITAVHNHETHHFSAPTVILAAGAPCYKHTGSDGHGLTMAAELGLTITSIKPALTAIPIKENWVKYLSGVTLSDCRLSIWDSRTKKQIAVERGELLFTHRGISGPVALNQSRWCDGPHLTLQLNLLPNYHFETYMIDFKKQIEKRPKITVLRHLQQRLPASLARIILSTADCPESLQGAHLSRDMLRTIAQFVTAAPLTPLPLGSPNRGMTCRGGIALKNMTAHSLMTKNLPGLFCAGDMLDLDGKTGGYNLQAAYA